MTYCDKSEAAIESALTLDRDAYRELGEVEVHDQLQVFARSTKITVDLDRLRLVLSGTDLGHHDADPHLADNAYSLPASVTEGEFARFHARLADYDLCMEDSWTGYFVSQCLAASNSPEPLVMIHLDDHTDMMDTLLVLTPDGLIDPGACQPFNPARPADWPAAIRSGAVGIGSFVTALYYLPQPVHVLHLNNVADSRQKRSAVVSRSVAHPLLPNARFASIEKRTRQSADQLGTYVCSDDATRLLRSLPEGRLVVHIDLDYFINDYNGNLGAVPALSIDALRGRASERMETFFEALARTGAKVERWIIATSPGFCCAHHWNWLLNALNEYIKDGSAASTDRGDSTD
ncbi:MAG: hypothetical protein ABJM11_11025 [Marinobacter sp.]|jgi:hypothetical protein|uniref:hypothetical protein n=1 Tax=Marinobacter sp. TaxID=50741 RepID=UPI0029B544EB|nr:hypothetical protein [Marinobacter sp.]